MSSDDDFMSGPMNKTKSGAVAPKAVLPWLFFGNDKTITEKKFLSNIQAIVDLDGVAEYKGDLAFHSFKPIPGILTADFGEDDTDEEEEDEDDEEEEEEEAEGPEEKFQQLLTTIYKALKEAKDAKKNVLLISKKSYYCGAVIAAYMLKSSKAMDKYLSLKQALEFLKTKDTQVVPGGSLLLHLASLEEQLFEEVSIKLPGNGRKAGGSFKAKPSGNKTRRRK